MRVYFTIFQASGNVIPDCAKIDDFFDNAFARMAKQSRPTVARKGQGASLASGSSQSASGSGQSSRKASVAIKSNQRPCNSHVLPAGDSEASDVSEAGSSADNR